MDDSARRLKELRLKRGLSQKALAKLVGVAQSTIGSIEAGTRGYGKSVIEIAKVLGVTTDYLEMRTDDMGAPPLPPANFADRRPTQLADWEWQAVIDLRCLSETRRADYLQRIRADAEDARSIAARAIEELRATIKT